jgi:hypothetical protein
MEEVKNCFHGIDNDDYDDYEGCCGGGGDHDL